jgi:RNA polymerase sigma-70 factor (ECF subfamily)
VKSGNWGNANEPPKIPTKNGAELMMRAAQGDQRAFDQIWVEYMSIVAHYVAHHIGDRSIVEEVVQEVFLRVWQSKANYRPEAALSTYLCACADRTLAEHRRRVGRDTRLSTRLSALADGHTDSLLTDPYVLLCRREREEAVRRLLARLSPRQKEALEVTYFQGCQLKEAARRTHCSVRAFESRLKRARARLRSLLHSC